MRLICGPRGFSLPGKHDALQVVLYGQADSTDQGSVGDAVKAEIRRRRLDPAVRAWDFLSIALSIATADCAGIRDLSPDGWTREFEIDIAVSDPEFWREQASNLVAALSFLTTDRWTLRFHAGGDLPPSQRQAIRPSEDSIVLLSGGLDSLIGAIDLVAGGRQPLAVSRIVRGDGEKQLEFARKIGGGLTHLRLNPNAHIPWKQDTSQRARSLIFIAFGIVASTTLACYEDGQEVPLFLCENGFIAINPPLTKGRLGSLSTRTAHPAFLGGLQRVLDSAGLRVKITNPYALKTKGEMMRECRDQTLLTEFASRSTSCGRFQRHKYRHCGRCIPCHVRRAAFLAWGQNTDETEYVFSQLGQDDEHHSGFVDVRSVGVALASVRQEGLDRWLGHSLSSPMITDRSAIRGMLDRGLEELNALHKLYGVK
ncbi:7-cyano-7-deazaguanine synthase (queuosine biosynthesis) [Pseudomonas sp. NFACC19-2]|nr:7-cyano-7-deazaguanine synthase (queuosine biosynthesis) [Pseudomonas sp. NFACC19-2]